MYQSNSHPGAGRSDRGVIRPIITGGVVVGALLITASVVGLDLIKNPIRTEAVDHTPAPILTELRDLADFHAAQAQFEVVIDEEQDVKLIPQVIAGERVQYVAIGNVDAVVDFAGLSSSAIVVDESNQGVTITLPAPLVGEPVIDIEQSHVMNRDPGVAEPGRRRTGRQPDQ